MSSYSPQFLGGSIASMLKRVKAVKAGNTGGSMPGIPASFRKTIAKAVAKSAAVQATQAAQAAFIQPIISPPDGSGYTPPSSNTGSGSTANLSYGPPAPESEKKIPWLLMAGIAFFVVKVFIMKKASPVSSPTTAV